jgi:hypothetical protein
MVSSSPQEQPTCSLESLAQSATASTLGSSAYEWNPLRSIELTNISPHVGDWESVIGSIDYSALRTLRVQGGFSFDDMKLLSGRVPVDPNPATPLKFEIEPSLAHFGPMLFGDDPPAITESNFSSTVAKMQQLLGTA